MKKRIIIVLILFVSVLLFGGVFYVYSILNKISTNKEEMPRTDAELGITPSPPKVQTEEKVEVREKNNILNIVLFGLDRRNPDEDSRSDSIMIISIDNKNQKIKVTSLMRDMYVPIEGHEQTKLNSAYAYGSAPLAIKTINSNFGTDIRNYVTVDFFGFEKVIDRVGGVDINISDSEASEINTSLAVPNVNGGLQTLDGRQAIAYCRIRHVGNNDYERTERQRRVLNELFKKIKAQGILNLPGTISTMLPYVETSLSKGEIIDIAMKVISFNTNSIDQFRLPVDGFFESTYRDARSVLVPDMEQNKNKLHEFIYGSLDQ